MASQHASTTSRADTAGTGMRSRIRARLALWSRLLERANDAHPTV